MKVIVKYVNLSELTPYPSNPRKISEAAMVYYKGNPKSIKDKFKELDFSDDELLSAFSDDKMLN